MRICLSLMIIALAAPAVATAQSPTPTLRDLVQLGRTERARRARGGEFTGRIYTSEDIARYVAPLGIREDGDAIAAPGVDGPAGTDAVAPEAESDAVDALVAEAEQLARMEEAWRQWQEQMLAKQAEIQLTDDQMVRMQLDMNEIQGRVNGPTGTQGERNQARTELAAAVTGFRELRERMAGLMAEFEQLEAAEPPRPE